MKLILADTDQSNIIENPTSDNALLIQDIFTFCDILNFTTPIPLQNLATPFYTFKECFLGFQKNKNGIVSLNLTMEIETSNYDKLLMELEKKNINFYNLIDKKHQCYINIAFLSSKRDMDLNTSFSDDNIQSLSDFLNTHLDTTALQAFKKELLALATMVKRCCQSMQNDHGSQQIALDAISNFSNKLLKDKELLLENNSNSIKKEEPEEIKTTEVTLNASQDNTLAKAMKRLSVINSHFSTYQVNEEVPVALKEQYNKSVITKMQNIEDISQKSIKDSENALENSQLLTSALKLRPGSCS